MNHTEATPEMQERAKLRQEKLENLLRQQMERLRKGHLLARRDKMLRKVSADKEPK